MALQGLPGSSAKAAGMSAGRHQHVVRSFGIHSAPTIGRNQIRQSAGSGRNLPCSTGRTALGLSGTALAPVAGCVPCFSANHVLYHAFGTQRCAKQLVAATAGDGIAPAHEAADVQQDPPAPALNHVQYYAMETPDDLAPQDMQFYHLATGPLELEPRQKHYVWSKHLGTWSKPWGVLWLTCRSEWAKWARYQMRHLYASYTHLYRIDLDLTNIFILDNDDDLKRLEPFIGHRVISPLSDDHLASLNSLAAKLQGSPVNIPVSSIDDQAMLNWDLMQAAGYKGILVTKRAVKTYGSIFSQRVGSHFTWINLWDVCSAAIWDISAIRGEPELVASGLKALNALHDSFLSDRVFREDKMEVLGKMKREEEEGGEAAGEEGAGWEDKAQRAGVAATIAAVLVVTAVMEAAEDQGLSRHA